MEEDAERALAVTAERDDVFRQFYEYNLSKEFYERKLSEQDIFSGHNGVCEAPGNEVEFDCKW